METEEMYTIQEEQPEASKPDPIAEAFKMIATTQQEQSKLLSNVAEKIANPNPVTVYQQPVSQPINNDPIQNIQNEINSHTEQLNQMLENGDIDRETYFQKYERIVAPKKEQLRDMKFKNELESTKNELTKTYQEQLAEQKKIIDQIQHANIAKSEQEKIRMIADNYPDATKADTPLFKEMQTILSDGVMSSIFTDPNGNKDQYLALARMADANLKAKGIATNSRGNQAVNQFGAMGNPGVYQNQGTQTSFTANDIEQLRNSEYGQHLNNERLIRFSAYNQQIKESGSVTISDWLKNNA